MKFKEKPIIIEYIIIIGEKVKDLEIYTKKHRTRSGKSNESIIKPKGFQNL